MSSSFIDKHDLISTFPARERVVLYFANPVRHRVKKVLQRLFNLSRGMKEFYEEQLCYIVPAYELYFELEKK